MSYLSLSDPIFDRPVALRDAYRLMEKFIVQYNARGESSTVALLSDTGVGAGGSTCDPAQLYDFVRIAGEHFDDQGLLDAAESV